jgi:hypothetical protein
MHLRSAALCAIVAASSLYACRRAEDPPKVGSPVTRQAVQVVHYGDDGPLATIAGKPGLFRVIFDPDCRGCKLAEKATRPASVLDTSLCEFEMIVSGKIEKTRGLDGTLRVRRIDTQPEQAGHRQGKPEQPCHRQL